MSELADYSGEYDPEFSHDKFTKEMLLQLLQVYSEYILRIDGFWYLTVMNRWGNDVAVDCDIEVWEKAKLFELKSISEACKIQGNDVVTFMKYLQACPWVVRSECEMDIKNNNHAILTHYTCPTLFALEKEGKGREKRQCSEIDAKFIAMMAHYFNPEIQVTPLKLPPRESENDICCQWEFKLDRS